MKKIIKNIILLITLIIVIMGLLNFILNRKNIISNLPIRILIVKSNSMYPTFSKNDMLFIKKQKDYKEKDIITFITEDGSLVTHRVFKKVDEGYITKGDNNNVEDEKIVKNQDIKGKTIMIINKRIKILVLFFIIILFLMFRHKEGGLN